MIDRSQLNLIQQMEDWGYYLLPETHPHSPGYTGLLVAIRATPTLKHFDPESIELTLARPGGSVEDVKLLLERPPASARLVPGLVRVTDRKNKQERFFTFGGTLDSASVPGETVYSLRSSAPILWLSSTDNCGGDELASEAGRILAEIRASFVDREEEFYNRLCALEPLTVYVASLYSIFGEYEEESGLRYSYPDCHTMLHEEKKWLESVGLWTSDPVTLESLMLDQ